MNDSIQLADRGFDVPNSDHKMNELMRIIKKARDVV